MNRFLENQTKISAQLAKTNINILNCNDKYIYYEYQFRMRNGQYKWAKTVYVMANGEDLESGLQHIINMVRDIRIEAEDDYSK